MNLQRFYDGLDALFQTGSVQTVPVYLEDWLDIARREEDAAGLVAVWNEMASYCRAKGELDRARTLYGQVFDKLEEMGCGQTEDAATAMINLGLVYILEKDPDRAIDLYDRAEALLLSLGFAGDYRMAALYNDVSMARRDRGDLPEAEAALQKAFQILDAFPQCRAELATTHVNLGEVQIRLDKLDDADAHFRAALQIFEDEFGGVDVHYASACGGMAELAYRKGDLPEAARYYEKTLVLIERDYGRTPSYELIERNLNRVRAELAQDPVRPQP